MIYVTKRYRTRKKTDTGKASKSKTEAAADKVSKGIVMGDPTCVGSDRKRAFGNQLDSNDGKRHFVSFQEGKTFRKDAKTSMGSVREAQEIYNSFRKEWDDDPERASGVVGYKEANGRVFRNAMVAKAHAEKRLKKRSHGDPTKMATWFEQDRKTLKEMSTAIQKMSEDLESARASWIDTHGEVLDSIPVGE